MKWNSPAGTPSKCFSALQRSLLSFGSHRVAVKSPKCSSCKKNAEFYYQKDEKARKTYFCEDHGLEFMQREKAAFLPRV